MFRTLGDHPSSWESLLPPELLRLLEELARVDAMLDDRAFFAPFAPYFHPVLGRPSTPVECYLRLMFLKFRYRLGYESLCTEVSDSITTTECGAVMSSASHGTADQGRVLPPLVTVWSASPALAEKQQDSLDPSVKVLLLA